MTIDQVIEMGQNIQKPEYGMFSQFTTTIWFWVIGLFIVGFIVMGIEVASRLEVGSFGSFLCMIATSIALFNVFGSTLAENGDYNKKIDEWRETVATPFIQSLPVQKKEVVYIKIDPELGSNVQGSSIFGTGYTYTSEIERTPVSFSYKDKGIVTKTLWAETTMELTDEEKPYVEFQKLEKDLGHGIEAGIYNYKIHLPDSYQFTEIK